MQFHQNNQNQGDVTSKLNYSLTDEWLECYQKTKYPISSPFFRLAAMGALPLGVDKDYPRVKEVLRDLVEALCQRYNWTFQIRRTGNAHSMASNEFEVIYPDGQVGTLWSPPWHEMMEDEEDAEVLLVAKRLFATDEHKQHGNVGEA